MIVLARIKQTPAQTTTGDKKRISLFVASRSGQQSSQAGDKAKARKLRAALGQYSLVAIALDVVAAYRDAQLAEDMSRDTVRLQLALLSHIFETAIKA